MRVEPPFVQTSSYTTVRAIYTQMLMHIFHHTTEVEYSVHDKLKDSEVAANMQSTTTTKELSLKLMC